MKITRITGGPVQTNCYVLTDEETGLTAVVDPGFESGELDDAVLAAGNVRAILLTHAHFDHITGVAKLRGLTGARIYLSAEELMFVADPSLNAADFFFGGGVPQFRVDYPLGDGDEIGLGNLTIRVLRTPGHTVGSCCFLVGDALFAGDTLMKLSCGRTDLPTGSYPQILDSLQKLAKLPGDYHVYPGHGSESTLSYERKNNSYMGTGRA